MDECEALARGAILPGLYALVASGRPIIGAGAGTGISAKCEEDGRSFDPLHFQLNFNLT